MTENSRREFDSDEPPERLTSVDSDDGGNWHVVFGVVVAAVLIGWLVFDGLSSETYFFTVDEAVAKGDTIVGSEMRVKGRVVKGSIEGNQGTIGRDFSISHKGDTIRVSYDKALPDTFQAETEVVATGTLSSGGTLNATEVMVKCPSRYEGNPEAQHPDNIPKG
jgi:cytochrome c-type biogenesis protein CcmE